MPHGLGLECAQGISSQPFGGLVVGDIHGVQGWDEGQVVSNEKQESSNQTQSLDDLVSVLVFARLGQGSIDHMAEIRLKANVQKTQQSQHLVDGSITSWVIKTSCNEHILHSLKHFHGEKKRRHHWPIQRCWSLCESTKRKTTPK